MACFKSKTCKDLFISPPPPLPERTLSHPAARRADSLHTYSDIKFVTDDGPDIYAHRFALFASSVLTTQIEGKMEDTKELSVTGIRGEALRAILQVM